MLLVGGSREDFKTNSLNIFPKSMFLDPAESQSWSMTEHWAYESLGTSMWASLIWLSLKPISRWAWPKRRRWFKAGAMHVRYGPRDTIGYTEHRSASQSSLAAFVIWMWLAPMIEVTTTAEFLFDHRSSILPQLASIRHEKPLIVILPSRHQDRLEPPLSMGAATLLSNHSV